MDAGAVQTDEDAQLVRGPVGICGARGQEGSRVESRATKPGLDWGRWERQGLAVRVPGAVSSSAHAGNPFSLSLPTLGEQRYQHGNFWSAHRPWRGGDQDEDRSCPHDSSKPNYNSKAPSSNTNTLGIFFEGREYIIQFIAGGKHLIAF